jgi:hypothetical protein
MRARQLGSCARDAVSACAVKWVVSDRWPLLRAFLSWRSAIVSVKGARFVDGFVVVRLWTIQKREVGEDRLSYARCETNAMTMQKLRRRPGEIRGRRRLEVVLRGRAPGQVVDESREERKRGGGSVSGVLAKKKITALSAILRSLGEGARW